MRFSDRPTSFAVAVAPAVADGPLVVHTDTVATRLYKRDGYSYELVHPAEVRTRLNSDADAASALRRLAAHRYTEAELEADPGLSPPLSTDDAVALRSALGVRYLVLPAEFDVGDRLGRASGTATYRLYDLDTGDLVYEHTRPLNMNMSGEPGAIILSIALIGESARYFEDQFLAR